MGLLDILADLLVLGVVTQFALNNALHLGINGMYLALTVVPFLVGALPNGRTWVRTAVALLALYWFSRDEAAAGRFELVAAVLTVTSGAYLVGMFVRPVVSFLLVVMAVAVLAGILILMSVGPR